jgi:hypothetical protein
MVLEAAFIVAVAVAERGMRYNLLMLQSKAAFSVGFGDIALII